MSLSFNVLQVQTVGPISPLDFYNQWVKPVWNIEDKICLVSSSLQKYGLMSNKTVFIMHLIDFVLNGQVSDPRPTNPFNKTYSVDCLGNMVGCYGKLQPKSLKKPLREALQ